MHELKRVYPFGAFLSFLAFHLIVQIKDMSVPLQEDFDPGLHRPDRLDSPRPWHPMVHNVLAPPLLISNENLFCFRKILQLAVDDFQLSQVVLLLVKQIVMEGVRFILTK